MAAGDLRLVHSSDQAAQIAGYMGEGVAAGDLRLVHSSDQAAQIVGYMGNGGGGGSWGPQVSSQQ